MDGDRHREDPRIESQTSIGDAAGEGLDEVDRIPGDLGDNPLGELCVVDGVGQLIGTGLEMNEGIDVDDERLAQRLLRREDAMMPDGGDAPQPDVPRIVSCAHHPSLPVK